MEFWWQSSPVVASFVGIHKYDHLLDDCSPEFNQEQVRRNREYVRRLEAVEPMGLSDDEHLDLRLVLDNLRFTIRQLEDIRYWQKDPTGYAQFGAYAVFVLAVRDFAPLEQRAAAMLSRLKEIPRSLKQGRSCLKDSPAIFTRTALEVTAGSKSFYQGFVPVIADQVPELKAEMLAASRSALDALDAYEGFLRDEHLPRSDGSFAVGRELFDFMLRTNHGLNYTADDLVAIGEQTLAETEQALAALSRDIAPGQEWWQIVKALKQEHPEAGGILDAYRAAMQRARDFTRERGLVTIPEGEDIQLIWTPPFQRATIPYAAYQSPPPFEKAQTGLFYVTPVNEQLPPEQQLQQLQGHCRYSIPVIALHEAYPGHHLQLVHANRTGSSIRRFLGTSVFVEGWALYCEEMMYEQGFYPDPRLRLMQLKDQVWRSCRVLIDVGLHTQGMTFDQAVDMLVNRAHLERVNAETEVKRYCSSPTQPMSYCIGKRQILALRRDYERQAGTQFNLREFHDRLLSYGSIPVELVRERMLSRA
jgi:uncharacterized protein (DUF885 family)